jgi:hypothetical protein
MVQIKAIEKDGVIAGTRARLITYTNKEGSLTRKPPRTVQ